MAGVYRWWPRYAQTLPRVQAELERHQLAQDLRDSVGSALSLVGLHFPGGTTDVSRKT